MNNGYECTCPIGYILQNNKFNCIGSICIQILNVNNIFYICLNSIHFTWDILFHIDIDECASKFNECAQICNNINGSYECACYEGYVLDYDKKSCIIC